MSAAIFIFVWTFSLTVEVNQSFDGIENCKGWEDCFCWGSAFICACATQEEYCPDPLLSCAFLLFNQTYQVQSLSVFSDPIKYVFWPGYFQNRIQDLYGRRERFFFFFIRRADKAPQWYSKLNCFSVLIKSFPLKLITSHIMVVLSNKIKQWP